MMQAVRSTAATSGFLRALLRTSSPTSPSVLSLTPRRFSNTTVKMSSSTPYKVIHTTEAPGAVAPYSQAVVHNNVAYVSGCIPFTPQMKLVEGGIEEQTNQALDNLFAVVKAAGSEPSVSFASAEKDMISRGRGRTKTDKRNIVDLRWVGIARAQVHHLHEGHGQL